MTLNFPKQVGRIESDCERVFTVKRRPCFIFVEQREQQNEPDGLVFVDQMSKIICQIQIELVAPKEIFTGTKGRTNESEERAANLVPGGVTDRMLTQSEDLKSTMERNELTATKKKNDRKNKKLEKQYHCTVCGWSCKTLKVLNLHIKQHEKWGTGEQCNVCNELIIGSKEAFQEHFKTHSVLKTTEETDIPVRETTEGKPHVCEICDRAFRLKSNLKSHVEIHMDEKKHKCVVCAKRFNTSSQLSMHKQTHRTVKKFVCDLCGRGFKLRANLKEHVATHLNEKRHECKVCGKRFNTYSQLCMHKKTHLEVKLFTCEFCGRTFKTQPKLKDHIKIHLNEKQHVCGICGKGYNTSSALSMHKRLHREKKTETGKQCTVCNEVVKGGKLAFRKHTKTHPVDYPCNSCTKRFNCKSNLKRHLEVHSSDLHGCALCDKAFNTTAKLTKHVRGVHRAEETPVRSVVAMTVTDQTLSF